MIVRLLRELGYEVELASRLRTYDRTGDPGRQERLRMLGRRIADRTARRLGGVARPDAWLTYHCYHKAPDLIGPVVSDRLSLPYLIIEPSIAPRQAPGRWAPGYAAALLALRSADVLLPVTRVDADTLARTVAPLPILQLFPPFLDAAPYREAAANRTAHRHRLASELGLDLGQPWLLAVAMMRRDVKLDSYMALADALEGLSDRRWQLLLAGDGEARREIAARYASLGVDRLRFVGELTEFELAPLYAAADLLVWPAFREAYGMALLEAQAAGLPVIACDEGGVADIVADGVTGMLVHDREMAPFAAAVRVLLDDAGRRRALGGAAAARVANAHDWPVAAARLREALSIGVERRARRMAGST